MLFTVKWDATGITDDRNLVDQTLSRDAAAVLTEKMRAAGTLPAGVHSIYGAEVDEDGGWEDGECKVFVSVELVVEAVDCLEAVLIGTDAFLTAVASAMIGDDAQSEYDLGGFVVLETDVYVDSAAARAG
jgi:hypothetical protein